MAYTKYVQQVPLLVELNYREAANNKCAKPVKKVTLPMLVR